MQAAVGTYLSSPISHSFVPSAKYVKPCCVMFMHYNTVFYNVISLLFTKIWCQVVFCQYVFKCISYDNAWNLCILM